MPFFKQTLNFEWLDYCVVYVCMYVSMYATALYLSLTSLGLLTSDVCIKDYRTYYIL